MTASALDTQPEDHAGGTRVLTLSTIGFTLMFAVWLMFGILGKPISKEFDLSEVQLSWIIALAVLNGSLWRLPTGMITDRIGGRKVMTFMLLASAIPAYLVSRADSYAMILILAFFIGFAGNSFSCGIAWNSAWQPRQNQGFALGLFGAGNVGASVTKFVGPPLVAGTTVGVTYFGIFPGGWRFVPVLYAVLLVVVAAATWFLAPKQDRVPGRSRPLSQQLAPLARATCVAVQPLLRLVLRGLCRTRRVAADVLHRQLPGQPANRGLAHRDLHLPGVAAAPGGRLDLGPLRCSSSNVLVFRHRAGPSAILMMPNGHIVISQADGSETEHLGYAIGLVPFVMIVFVLGCGMGIGKAAVFKHIPEYFPDNVGSVGGMLGMLGGMGGFFLPPLFAYTKAWSGFPSSTFFVIFVLTAICALWMHWTAVHMLHGQSPELARHIEKPDQAPEEALV